MSIEDMEGNLKMPEWSIDEVYEKIKEKYDEEVAKKFKEQKIDGKALRYLASEGSLAQYEKCGLTAVGEQLLLKEMVLESPLVPLFHSRRNKKPSIAEVKTMSDMNQRIYKAKRKAVSQAAIQKWPGNDIPVFKKDDSARKELDDLVKSLESECSFEPAAFNANSIRQHILDVLNERRRKLRNGHDYNQVDKRTIKKAKKTEVGIDSSDSTDCNEEVMDHGILKPIKKTASTSSRSSNSCYSDRSDQSGDTEQLYSSCDDDEENIIPSSIPEANSKKETGLTESVAKLVICVAYNAIKISDVQRGQLQSSARVLGLKNLGNKDKTHLVRVVANGLVNQGFIEFVGNPQNPKRDDVKKIKPF